jgi:hypothetical protein
MPSIDPWWVLSTKGPDRISRLSLSSAFVRLKLLLSADRCSPEPTREYQEHIVEDGIRAFAVIGN